MTITKEIRDEFLKSYKRLEDLLCGVGQGVKELKIKLVEPKYGAEVSAHLGYKAGRVPSPEQNKRCNG